MLAGITTDAVARPELSATALPTTTGVEFTVKVAVSPGVNPPPVAVRRCPGVRVDPGGTVLPLASVAVTSLVDVVVVVVPSVVVDVVVAPGAVVDVVVDVLVVGAVVVVDVLVVGAVVVVDDVLVVGAVVVDDVLVVVVDVLVVGVVVVEVLVVGAIVVVVDVLVVGPVVVVDVLVDVLVVVVVGGGVVPLVQVTCAGLSAAFVTNVIWTFQYLSSWSASAGPRVHAMPTL
jgi:hypothetical protein